MLQSTLLLPKFFEFLLYLRVHFWGQVHAGINDIIQNIGRFSGRQNLVFRAFQQ